MLGINYLKPFDVLFASEPTKIGRRDEKVRGESASREFSAPRTITVLEYAEVAPDLIGHALTETTAGYLNIRHFGISNF